MRATCKCDTIKNKNTNWVPFIFLNDENDEIKIIV